MLFFILLTTIYLLVNWQNYREQQQYLDEKIYNKMKIFSYKPLNDTFTISFIDKANAKSSTKLEHNTDDIYALFEVMGSTEYLMRVAIPKSNYQNRLNSLKSKIFDDIYLYMIIILLISFLLAVYTLYPLKKALELNDEFVKDILHDINTPLSSLLINLKIIQKRSGTNTNIMRMENNIETIKNLQSNLKAFLHQQPGKKERFSLDKLLSNRIEYFKPLYPDINFNIFESSSLLLECNKESFTRVIDNIISNAGKYNIKNGDVNVIIDKNILMINDTGIGIKETKKVFNRYYKEGERGIGLGLHITKKLAKELKIRIKLESELNHGTKVSLDLSEVIFR